MRAFQIMLNIKEASSILLFSLLLSKLLDFESSSLYSLLVGLDILIPSGAWRHQTIPLESKVCISSFQWKTDGKLKAVWNSFCSKITACVAVVLFALTLLSYFSTPILTTIFGDGSLEVENKSCENPYMWKLLDIQGDDSGEWSDYDLTEEKSPTSLLQGCAKKEQLYKREWKKEHTLFGVC